jgi:hypothetical protein
MRKLRLYRHRIHMAWLVLRGKAMAQDPRALPTLTTTSGTGTMVTTMQGGWR